MNADYIKDLIERDEGFQLEFKDYRKEMNHDIYETVCSFSNRAGGLILIGIEEGSHAIVGVPKDKVLSFQKDFTNACANKEILSPKLTYELEETLVEGKSVLSVSIYPSVAVESVSVKDKRGMRIIDRLKDADVDITDESALVNQLHLRKIQFHSADTVFPALRFEDLRSDLIERARRMAVHASIDHPHPWGTMEDQELLSSAGLFLRDPITNVEGYTLSAALLFGDDRTIMACCPTHRTDCLVRINNLDRYDDRDNIRTNLLDSYERMMAFIAKHLKSGYAQDENGLTYYPRDRLFKEAIANILIHREFFSPVASTMVIYQDRVEFHNPCRAVNYGEITPSHNFHPISKNPRIASVFSNIGLADELGSGVLNMFKYSRVYTGSVPSMVEEDEFVTIIPLQTEEENSKETTQREQKILNYIEEKGSITSKEAIKLLNLSRSVTISLLNEMISTALIFRHGEARKVVYDKKKETDSRQSKSVDDPFAPKKGKGCQQIVRPNNKNK
jgi:ATP-dependent DNA helicase RecG